MLELCRTTHSFPRVSLFRLAAKSCSMMIDDNDDGTNCRCHCQCGTKTGIDDELFTSIHWSHHWFIIRLVGFGLFLLYFQRLFDNLINFSTICRSFKPEINFPLFGILSFNIYRFSCRCRYRADAWPSEYFYFVSFFVVLKPSLTCKRAKTERKITTDGYEWQRETNGEWINCIHAHFVCLN